VHDYNGRQTTDSQTDHATEKCVAIGGIACARAIPPNYCNRVLHLYILIRGRLNRPHYGSCPTVCLSQNFENKKTRKKTKIGANVFQGGGDRCANCQLKGQRVSVAQCSGRVRIARRTAAYHVGTGPASSPALLYTLRLYNNNTMI